LPRVLVDRDVCLAEQSTRRRSESACPDRQHKPVLGDVLQIDSGAVRRSFAAARDEPQRIQIEKAAIATWPVGEIEAAGDVDLLVVKARFEPADVAFLEDDLDVGTGMSERFDQR